jgi:O-antigen/teichoic acid export membrane protein
LGRLSIDTALGCLIGGALLGAAWQAWRLRLWLGPADDIRDLARHSWGLGKWDVLGGGVANVAAQIMPWTLAAWHGSMAAAQLQAVANLLGATHPVLFGLSNIVTPAVARSAASPRPGVKRTALLYASAGFVLLLPYFILLLAFPDHALAFVYGKTSQYIGVGVALRMFVVIYIGLYLLHMGQAFLNGLGRSRDVSFIGLIGLLAQLVIVMPLAIRFGLTAACAGAVAAELIQCLAVLRSVRRADGSLAQPRSESGFGGIATQTLRSAAAGQIVPSGAARD